MSARTIQPGDPLTPRQAEVLEAIRAYRATHGYSPGYRELFGSAGKHSVQRHIATLIRKGALRQLGKGLGRSLVPVDEGETVPLAIDDVCLPPGQRAVFRTIRAWLATRGVPPTIREIGVELGISSPNGVRSHLNALVRKGFLRREHQRARSLVPVVPAEVVQ